NVHRAPFADVRVRRAFALAIDRERFVATQPGSGIRVAHSIIPPGVDGYVFSGETSARYDPVEARRLLAEAGYPEGRGFPPVELSLNTNVRHQEFAQIVQQMWRHELGVVVKIVNKEGKIFYDERLRGEFQLCRSAWVGDYIDASAFLTNYLS